MGFNSAFKGLTLGTSLLKSAGNTKHLKLWSSQL